MSMAVRASDRKLFRRCRVQWNYSSINRLSMRSKGTATPLKFGSAIHEALQVKYDHLKANDPTVFVNTEAELAFTNYMNDWKADLVSDNMFDSFAVEWGHLNTLGLGMLSHYWEYAKTHDKDWEPVYSEVDFEVPIPISKDLALSFVNNTTYDFTYIIRDTDEYYLAKWVDGKKELIVVKGRIDVIMRHRKTGIYWIWDHKTAARFYDNTDWLNIDTQASTYFWVCSKMLGIEVGGVIFNYLKKAVPAPPKENKNGSLSKDKSQSTTRELYIKAIEERNLPLEMYEDFLNSFEPPEYFQRIEIAKSAHELPSIEHDLLGEAIDMFRDDVSIYPDANPFNCNTCAFKHPCWLRQEGLDDIDFLQNSGLYVRIDGY